MTRNPPANVSSTLKNRLRGVLRQASIRKWSKRLHRFTKALPQSECKEFVLKDTDACLVLAPHADDESIGLGGLMLLHPEAFHVACVTDCATGNPDKCCREAIRERKLEFEMAMKSIHTKRFHYNLTIRSDNLEKSYTEFESLLDTFDLSKYRHVFLPHHFDQHQDHMAITRLFRRYCMRHRLASHINVLLFEVWTPMTMLNRYVDISDVMEEKMRLINTYASQTRVIDYASRVQGLNRYRGMIPQVDYAECFQQISVKDFTEMSP